MVHFYDAKTMNRFAIILVVTTQKHQIIFFLNCLANWKEVFVDNAIVVEENP